MIPETGMKILVETPCRVGNHVWIKTGSSPSSAMVQDGDTCACRLMYWWNGEVVRGVTRD